MNRIALAVLFAAAAWAQKFEVASIKPSHGAPGRVSIGIRPGNRFVAENVPLRFLISFAYDIRDYQLTGLPGWADSERYDINAKPEGAEDAANSGQAPSDAEVQTRQAKLRAMLQDLLADRFGLKIHRETKELPIYALVVAKGGSKLVESDENAPPVVEPPGGRGGNQEIATRGGGRRAPLMRMSPGGLTGQGISMQMLVMQLSSRLGHNVVDKTGLTGKYDIRLSWTPDQAQIAPGPGPDGPRAEAPPSDGPSIFTAVQEQLGLKLESQKGPVDIVIIDHVEKPTEN